MREFWERTVLSPEAETPKVPEDRQGCHALSPQGETPTALIFHFRCLELVGSTSCLDEVVTVFPVLHGDSILLHAHCLLRRRRLFTLLGFNSVKYIPGCISLRCTSRRWHAAQAAAPGIAPIDVFSGPAVGRKFPTQGRCAIMPFQDLNRRRLLFSRNVVVFSR
ncbi:hypothetical protein FA13DRAFT_1342352 [Coprinellus micaceus]|uniref:Uncharacterized protein n=1 Tax=Coprinellus micaceus TaxID=71717 RepID=A0A4Y7TMM4_COPMI|nr:hypothetical protein FA13DRAFT_1342352 [Coprinellus micaceus]